MPENQDPQVTQNQGIARVKANKEGMPPGEGGFRPGWRLPWAVRSGISLFIFPLCALQGNNLQTPAAGPNARFSLGWGPWFPREAGAADWGSVCPVFLFDWENPRLCRGGSRSLTFAGVSPGVFFPFFSQNRQEGTEHGAVPTGLRMNCWFRQPHPTLKRGANNHCAYGAGDGLRPALSASLRGRQP